ncbi:ABC transporter ATP-binding protein [Elioraea sp.]|uniref:ABC transporter ATP-binding protein n=1 Tax=Elioraea sp. TaxID=2185103 RepID=UPI0025C5641A|nr:ABC transporter ATP-binding protein [Elioraea sp.]
MTKRFGSVRAVDAVSFALEEGSLTTLLGPSGCGKTTTLRLIAGLELPDEGGIVIDGRDVSGVPAAERRVAMVFQSYALFPHMSVAENVGYGLVINGMRGKEVATRVGEMLETLGLGGLGSRQPGELSGGQQQRVAVARALVLRPRVLLFDEPLSNLDARLRRRVREDIRDLQRRLNLTVVYVTHDQQEALAVSDTVVVMRDGRIAQIGPPEALYDTPADAFVADFMGEANVIEGECVDRGAAGIAFRVGYVTIDLPLSRHPPGALAIAVRPEAILLSPHRAEGFPGRIVRAVFVGSHMEYEVSTTAGALFVVAPGASAQFRAGDAVSVTLTRVIPLPAGSAARQPP